VVAAGWRRVIGGGGGLAEGCEWFTEGWRRVVSGLRRVIGVPVDWRMAGGRWGMVDGRW
jgi:hypothetical protein